MNHDISVESPVGTEPETTSLAAIAERLTHRVRNPLSVITTAASQLQDSNNAAEGNDDKSFVDSIVIASEQIEAIFKRFVLYACPEPPVTEAVSINDLCRTEINRCRHEVTYENRGKIFFYPDENLPEAGCDPNQIRVILTDLVENGLRAAGPQGKVTIRTGHESDAVQFSIEDDGKGIAAKNREDWLIPFFTTWPGKNGLGLAIAERIVKAHKGSMELQARRDGGTKVIITLPRAEWIEE